MIKTIYSADAPSSIYLKDYADYYSLKEYEIKDIITIYEKQFKRKLTTQDIAKWFKEKNNLTVVVKDFKTIKPKIIAFARWFIYNNLEKERKIKNKIYTHISKTNNFIFLSDLASIEKPGGKLLINYILNISKEKSLPVITVPWKDSLITYYQQFGFKSIYPNKKYLPKVVMIKDKHN